MEYVVYIDTVRNFYQKGEIKDRISLKNQEFWFAVPEEALAFLKENYGQAILDFKVTGKEAGIKISNLFNTQINFVLDGTTEGEGEETRIEEIHHIYLEKHEKQTKLLIAKKSKNL